MVFCSQNIISSIAGVIFRGIAILKVASHSNTIIRRVSMNLLNGWILDTWQFVYLFRPRSLPLAPNGFLSDRSECIHLLV